MALLTRYARGALALWHYSLGTHAELEQRMTKQGLQEIMGNVYDLAGDPTHDAPFSSATQGSNPGLADPRQLFVAPLTCEPCLEQGRGRAAQDAPATQRCHVRDARCGAAPAAVRRALAIVRGGFSCSSERER